MGVGDEDFAAAVLEHSSSGIYAVDARGATVLMNPAARRILDPSECSPRLGTSYEELLSEHPTLCRLLREALAGRPPLSRAETVVERSDGDRLTLGFSIVPVPGEGGALRGAALVFRDLTPIERSGERARAQERLAVLGEMAASLAHELRNPLAGMELAAGLLQRRLAGDAESQDLLADLRGQMRRLADTVTFSLDFVRPAPLQAEMLDAAETLEDAISIALSRSPREVRVERCYAAPVEKLGADRKLLSTALVNLVVNAIEAMEEDAEREPLLRVSIAVTPGPSGATRELCIAIADNGPGIPEALRDRIFDPFVTTKGSGSGIGLANVQKIVAAHGGSLSFSTGATGSEFFLHLPIAGAP
jgi:PAS domain S-box-containing protein